MLVLNNFTPKSQPHSLFNSAWTRLQNYQVARLRTKLEEMLTFIFLNRLWPLLAGAK